MVGLRKLIRKYKILRNKWKIHQIFKRVELKFQDNLERKLVKSSTIKSTEELGWNKVPTGYGIEYKVVEQEKAVITGFDYFDSAYKEDT